jgi:hypothetical protein
MKVGATFLGCSGVAVVIVLCVSAIIGAFVWPYSINTWLEFANKEPVVVWWHGVLLGFVPAIGQVGLPLAAITWIAMLFLA